MMKTTLRRGTRLVCMFCLLCLFSASAGAEYFYPDGEEIKLIEHVARRMGRVSPFSSFPVHGSDLLEFAEKLAADPAASRLDGADIKILDALVTQLGQRREGVQAAGNLALAYQQRFSSNSFTIDDPDKMANAEDFRRVFLDMAPFLSFGASGGTFTGPWVAAQFDIRPAWKDEYNPSSNFLKEAEITYDILKRGVFAWNSRYINFFAGRDTTHWGNPAGSTLYASKLLPYVDSIRLNVPLGPFSFDYLLGSIIPKRAWHDVYDVDPPPVPWTNYFGFLDDERPSTILVAAHRFQWNFGRIKAGVGGTVVYVRVNNAFHITDVLPVMVYHNADVAPNNLSAAADLTWTVFPGFSVSGMLGFDDISARMFGIPDGDIPTIPGVILQADYSVMTESAFMDFHLEGGYTHYLWGNFHYDDPPFDRPGQREARLARAIFRYGPNHKAVLLPLTSPYGPGAVWGKFSASLDFPERRVKAGGELLLLTKNRDVNLVDTIYSIDDPTQDSGRLWYASLRFPVSYTRKSLVFSAQPGVRISERDIAFECTLGLRFSVSGTARFGGPY